MSDFESKPPRRRPGITVDSIEAGGDVIVAGEIGTVNLQGKALPLGDAVAGRPAGSATIATIHCQEFIIRQYTGLDLPVDALVEAARANGWYHDGRDARPSDVGKLLELHGIPTRRYADASSRQLATELGSGHSVIVGVDRPGAKQPHPMLEEIRQRLGLGTDDPVVVSRVDSVAPDPEQVVVVAPGERGAAIRYPMRPFLGAWKDRDFTMMATQGPPPLELGLELRFEGASHRTSGAGLIKIDEIEGHTVPSRRRARHHGLHGPSGNQPATYDERPAAVDPKHRQPSSPTSLERGLLERGLRDSQTPLASALGDALEADHEDELLDADRDRLGEDGGYDFG